MAFKSHFVPGILIGGIVLAGGGSVLAAAGGSSSGGSSAKEQYCPPNSPQAGQPQGGPGNNCGRPPETCPNGNPKPPPGNCGNTAGGPPEKRRARFKVTRRPARSCYTGKLTLDIVVANAPHGGKTVVYHDGRKVKTTGSKHFKLKIDAGKLKRGMHTVRLRIRGADGRMQTQTVRFRRC
jgi:hypothetical protein